MEYKMKRKLRNAKRDEVWTKRLRFWMTNEYREYHRKRSWKKNINGFDAKKYCKNNWVEDEATSERMAKK